jgi:quercetin dioxygenase-like cupin family protein
MHSAPLAGQLPDRRPRIVAAGADLRVTVLTLDAGQSVPWHYHSEVTDSFVCLSGGLVV